MFQVQVAGGKCADPVLDPPDGDAPITITVQSSTAGAHLFWTKAPAPGINPTHNGDNPTGSTSRMGSNSGAIYVGNGAVVRVLAYKNGLTDSNIVQGVYTPPGTGG